MGYIFVEAELGNVRKKVVKKVRLLADTGAGFMVIPPSMAREIGVEPITKIEVMLADKRKSMVDLGFAYVKIKEREAIVQVIIMESPEPLLGTFTMQVLGLTVDPITEEVKPTRSFALGLLNFENLKV
ncbi:MAG: aspartyl protease family protein [Nitrososphaerales archaeon]